MSKKQTATFGYRLHDNLKCLALLHPKLDTDLFKKCIHSNMFEVPNKAGFHQVMHFLFSIVYPEESKKKYQWPVFDKNSEKQFLIGVRVLLDDLNKDFPEANIPKVVPSVLMNPGGREKFSHFMWVLSMFVLQHTLQAKIGAHGLLPSPSQGKSDDDLRRSKLEFTKLTECYAVKIVAKKQMSIAKLRSDAEEQANLILQDLKSMWRQKEELKMQIKDAIHLLPFTSIQKSGLSNLDDSRMINDWSKAVAKSKQRVADLINQLKAYSDRMDACHKTLRCCANQPTTPILVDGTKLIVSRNHARSATSKIEAEEIVLTHFISSFSEDLRTLLTSLNSAEVLSFHKSVPHHSTLEQFELNLNHYATITNDSYQQLFEMAPAMYRFVDDYFSCYEETENGIRWAEEVSFLKPMAPLDFKNVSLVSNPNVAGAVCDGYNLLLTPEPNQLQRLLKKDINHNQPLKTVRRAVMSSSSSSVGNSPHNVSNPNTPLATVHAVNGNSAVTSASVKRNFHQSSAFARFKIKERLQNLPKSPYFMLNNTYARENTSVPEETGSCTQLDSSERKMLSSPMKCKTLSMDSLSNSFLDVSTDLFLQTNIDSTGIDELVFSPVDYSANNSSVNCASPKKFDRPIKQEFSVFTDSLPTVNCASPKKFDRPIKQEFSVFTGSLTNNTSLSLKSETPRRQVVQIKSETVYEITSTVHGGAPCQVVYSECHDETVDVLDLDLSDGVTFNTTRQQLKDDSMLESSPSGIFVETKSIAYASNNKRASLDDIIARYKNLKSIVVNSK